jgi:hypothetical protein
MRRENISMLHRERWRPVACVSAFAELGQANLKMGMAQAHRESLGPGAGPGGRLKVLRNDREGSVLDQLDAKIVGFHTTMYDACLIPAKRKH